VNLTAQQQAVVDAEGNFLLLACPGSGKTRSAAERAARLVGTPGMKVAICSYTNVGAERIGRVLADDLGVVLRREHFLGTIHKFLHRYVLRPYAHLLGAERGPFVHEGGGWPDLRVHGDNKQRITLDRFRYNADGQLVVTQIPRGVSGTEEQIIASVGVEVTRRKTAIFRQAGILTADDAMCVALKLLRDFPDVANAVAARFDELLLDEAQDTSELQLACLDVLHGTSALRSLVPVGDLEQSIFSFQGASAARCAKLAEDRGLDVLMLNENHRSSQLICNVAINFCSRETPDKAVGPHAGCEIPPEVTLYPVKDPGAAMAIYRERLAVHGLDVDDATVLARGWKVVDALNGRTPLFDDDDRQYRLGQLAARLAAGTLTRRDVDGAQRLISYCAWDETHLGGLEDDARRRLRKSAGELLERLPALDGDVRSWLVAARTVLHEVASSLGTKVVHTGGQAIRTKPEHEQHLAAEVFCPGPRDLHARTVHSFKGEDSDAVMVVIRRFLGSDPTSQLELWEAAVAGADPDPEKAEEQRVLFVALTRARRYCLVALPDDARGRKVAASCAGLGFELVTQA
jgi:DNA helicase II / ATP-dependent DNA helicase PcrA